MDQQKICKIKYTMKYATIKMKDISLEGLF